MEPKILDSNESTTAKLDITAARHSEVLVLKKAGGESELNPVQLVKSSTEVATETGTLAAIPEPSSALLLGLCGAALILFRRK
ncbi:PEP-CTERM sorting domain-containing protein [Luteolibacter sp. AS25]|uniref:PEP-CTERM sorting domain-containing protein n=1 Tax=Luteolibacter sp. AS25 TaxID=3135776 RepID=UPI00398A8B9C